MNEICRERSRRNDIIKTIFSNDENGASDDFGPGGKDSIGISHVFPKFQPYIL